MVFYTSPIPCVIIALIVLMHICSVFLARELAFVAGIVNICLHVGLAVSVFVLGSELSETVLLYASSLLVYLALYYFFKIRRNGGEG